MRELNKLAQIKIYYSEDAMYGNGIKVESTDPYTGKILKGTNIAINDNPIMIAGKVSILVYEMFIQYFLRKDPKKVKEQVVNNKLEGEYPFRRLFGRVWIRNKIEG